MAVLKASQAINMVSGLDMGKWTATDQDFRTNFIWGGNGSREAYYFGEYTYNGSGTLIRGEVTAYQAGINGITTYEIEGLDNIDIFKLGDYHEAEEFVERDQYLFRFNDLMTGSAFADKLYAWKGNDRLYGGSGHDTLDGGDGNDLLRGQAGNDILKSGSGRDILRFDTALNASSNVNTINAFSVQDDTIELDNAIFKKLVLGALSASNFRANGTGTAKDANDYIVYETDTGKLFYDADGSGSGAKVLFAELITGNTHPTLIAADFNVM